MIGQGPPCFNFYVKIEGIWHPNFPDNLGIGSLKIDKKVGQFQPDTCPKYVWKPAETCELHNQSGLPLIFSGWLNDCTAAPNLGNEIAHIF